MVFSSEAAEDDSGYERQRAIAGILTLLSAPVDGAESILAEQRVIGPDRATCLRLIARCRERCIALRPEVFQRDAMLLMVAAGQRHIGPAHVFMAAA